MKRFIILAAATLAFASCTKDYTCECVTPETNQTIEMPYKTNRKAHASRLCSDWQGRQRSAVAGQENVTCKIK